MTDEVTQIRLYILELIKFTCKRARQHNHDKHHSIGIRAWGYEFLHNECTMYIRELVWILNQTKDK
jgi:hypothetical protein